MADTARSLVDLKSILADNTAGEISPQDLRDMLVSCLSVGGGLSCFEASTEQTDIGLTGSKLTCFTTNSNASGIIPDHTNDQITININGNYDIFFQAAFIGSNGADMEFRLRKNGTELSWGTSRIANSTQNGSCSFLAMGITLVENDILTVYVQSDTETDDVTVRDAQFSARMVG